jgi:hypothetical protein
MTDAEADAILAADDHNSPTAAAAFYILAAMEVTLAQHRQRVLAALGLPAVEPVEAKRLVREAMAAG